MPKLGEHAGCWHCAYPSPWWVDCKTGRFALAPRATAHLEREELTHGGLCVAHAHALSAALAAFTVHTVERLRHDGEDEP